MAASSIPPPVCGEQGDKEARVQVPRPEPGPKLWALSSEVPSPLSPSTHSWSPLALQSCSQRERGQDAFPKDQGYGLATFQGWAEFILEI